MKFVPSISATLSLRWIHMCAKSDQYHPHRCHGFFYFEDSTSGIQNYLNIFLSFFRFLGRMNIGIFSSYVHKSKGFQLLGTSNFENSLYLTTTLRQPNHLRITFCFKHNLVRARYANLYGRHWLSSLTACICCCLRVRLGGSVLFSWQWSNLQ